MKILKGLVDASLLNKFPSGFPQESGYLNYVANCVGLEGILACAAVFSPEFVECDGMVFLSENVKGGLAQISSRYGSTKEQLEKFNNLTCLSDFFLLAEDEACEDEYLMDEFGKVLIYYWRMRLAMKYPDRKFKFILEDDLFDEDGLCLTFFEG
ncbi:hypothetical protein [Microbulbifer sp. PSTR4-B]|uniref:hypothetical protein n=1 Tax=Microbulbifer sp. PSTR4-B TaxID=3243396 RepID=UPI00403A60E1